MDYNKTEDAIFKRAMEIFKDGAVFSMTDIGRMIYEDGMKEGEYRGEQKGKALAIIKLLTKKFGKLPEGYKEKIMELDEVILELMISEIFDYKSLEDIKKYLD